MLEKLKTIFRHKPKEPAYTEEQLKKIAELQQQLKEQSLEELDFRPLWEEPAESGLFLYILAGAGAFLSFITLIVVLIKK